MPLASTKDVIMDKVEGGDVGGAMDNENEGAEIGGEGKEACSAE
jgi:hypothetical protein